MKTTQVTVPWKGGLHLRPAAKLVTAARGSKSSLTLRNGEKSASLQSIISLVALCASLGTPLVLQAQGEDEERVSTEIAELFAHDTIDD